MSAGITKRAISTSGTVLLFLFLFGIRLLHPTADPPADLDWSGGIFFDEGTLVHGARSKILFGRWDLDEWSDFYLSPILFYIKWLVLSVVGVGIAQERVIPIGFSFLTLILFYLAFEESFDRRTAMVTTFLLGFNYVFVMFNRLGLTETSLVFFMVLTAYLWQRGFCRAAADGEQVGAYRLRSLPFFLSGVSALIAYVFKSFPYFLPVPLVAAALSARLLRRTRALGPRDGDARAPNALAWRGPIGLCLVGMVIPFLVWYVVFYRRYSQPIKQAMRYFQVQSVPTTLLQLQINVSHIPFFDYFVQTPVVLLFSCLGVGHVIYLFFHDRDELRPLDLFMLCWFLAHFFVYAVLTYRPVRYYVPVLPPMCALAGRTMLIWGSGRAVRLPDRLSVASLPFLAAWLTVLLGYEAFQVASRYAPVLVVGVRGLAWDRRLLMAAGISMVLVGVAAVICWRWGGRSWHIPRRVAALGFLALPLAVSVAVDGYHYLQWAARPRYLVRDISRELGRTLNHAFIAGLGAPAITLENSHRALHVYENFFNYQDTFDRYPVTHLFTGAFNQEVDFYYRKYADHMRRATPLKVYAIKDSHFYLYSLVEPSVQEVRVSKESYRAGEAVTVTMVVKNQDAANPREVRAGWVLHPVEPGPGDVTVTVPLPLRLKPGETTELTLSGPAPPGTYRLLAFTLPAYRNVFEAEFLTHRIGEKRKDPAAVNGETWRVRGADPQQGQAVFGPYLRYPSGYLTAAFRLKTSDNAVELPVARIDVATAGGRNLLAMRDLRGVDFKAARTYEEFRLSRFLDNLQMLEFRVGSYKRTNLWIDRIEVEFTRGEWYARPITVTGVRR